MNMSERSRLSYGSIIIAGCFLIQAMGVGTYIAFGVFFKPLLGEFGWSRATVAGASSLAFLLMGFLGILVGNLNDRFGPRIIMAVTGVLYGAGYFLLSQVNSVWQYYLAYGLVVGMGLSSIDVIPMTVITRWFVRRRGMMTGLVKVGTGAGQLVMPLTAGLLIQTYGWRHASIILGVILCVFIVCTGQLLRRDPAQMGLLPDGGARPLQGRAGAPEGGLTAREALRTPQLWLFCLIAFVGMGCLLTVMLHIVPHASDIGLNPIKAAGVLSTLGGMSMLGRLMTGIAIDRIGTRKSMILCFVVIFSGFLWLQLAEKTWMLYLFAAVYGLAHGGFFTLLSPMVAELFGIKSHGVLIGIAFFCGNFGGAVGPVLAGHIFDIAHSYQPVFLIMAAVAVAGLILTAFLKPPLRDKA